MTASPAQAVGALADWSAGLRDRDAPDDQLALVPLRILDTLGLVFAGLETAAARAALHVARRQGASDECVLIGGGARSSAASAALAHATIAHCRDFDDTFPVSVVHPGSTIVSTALAVGEAANADDREILLAVLIGYEIAARLGAAGGRRFHARGFHATGVVGPIAAAAAAARLYGLDAAQTANALALSTSMSAGLMSFMDDGAWSKWLHTGWSAHGGVVAAQLAADGFRGPATGIDGRFGIFGAFLHGEDVDTTAITEGLGTVWRGGEAHFKYYPCAHVIQPYIDAAIDTVSQHDLAPGDIGEVSCVIAPWAADIVCKPRGAKLRPVNALSAIASLPYQVAVGIVERAVDLTALEEDMRSRPDILEITDRVKHREDPSLGRGFDGKLELTTRDGRLFEVDAELAPAAADKVIAKFRLNAARAIPPDLTTQIEEALIAAPKTEFAELAGLLARVGQGVP